MRENISRAEGRGEAKGGRALRIQDPQVRVSHPDRPYYRRLIGIERERERGGARG